MSVRDDARIAPTRRLFLAGAATLAVPGLARAQARFPDRPIQLVVPWPAVAAVAVVVIVTGLVLPLVAARLLGRRRPADEIRFGEAG